MQTEMDEKKSAPSSNGVSSPVIPMMVEGKPVHKPLYILPIIAAWVCFALVAVFNAMASGPGLTIGLFQSSTANISNKYYTEVTPAGWTFIIWGFIYAYQVLFLGYGVSTIFRKSPDGCGYLYYSPGHMSPWIYLVYCLNNALNVIWIFLFDREHMIPALFIILGMSVTLYICIIISAKDLVKYGHEFTKSGRMYEIRLVRYIVHNAFGIYATWVTIATLLNLAIVLQYFAHVRADIAGTISLCILTVIAITYWILDNFVFDKYLRYLWMPYVVLHVALIGSLSGNWDLKKRNTIFTLVLLCLGFTLTMVKLGLVIFRWRKKPIFTGQTSSKVNIHA